MAEVNKETFFQGINRETEQSKDFFMKIYGYSLYDLGFETTVLVKLKDLGIDEAITGYEGWKQEYEAEQLVENKKVAHWYVGESEKQWNKLKKELQTKVVIDWKEKRILLLQRKKSLLRLMQN